MNNAAGNMRKDRRNNRPDYGQHDDDPPKPKHICRIETFILNHLKYSDQIESQNYDEN
jgi:hypothetical protein